MKRLDSIERKKNKVIDETNRLKKVCEELGLDFDKVAQACVNRSTNTVIEMLNIKEFKEHPELFTLRILTNGNLNKIIEMLHSDEYKEHPELFTSTTLTYGDLDSIRGILNLPNVKNGKYSHLITSTILAKGNSMLRKLPEQFELAEEYGFSDYITIHYLLKSPSENYAMIKYLKDSDIPIITKQGKLNPAFRYTPKEVYKNLGITRDVIMKMYPYEKKDKIHNNGQLEQTDSEIEINEDEEISIEQLQEKLALKKQENDRKENILRQELLKQIKEEEQKGKELDELIMRAKEKNSRGE